MSLTTPRVVAILPAHNEEDQIALTLQSLLSQTRTPDLIVVASDNSTDSTVEIARQFERSFAGQVVVFETVANPHRKAGAMNQAYDRYGRDADYVMTMDADTVFDAHFLQRCLSYMEGHPEVGGASACPMLKEQPSGLGTWGAYLWRMAKLDFGGYMRMLVRWNMKPDVLSGYGTIFRADALRKIGEEYGGVPWAVDSIVEDYRISLDLRRLGWSLAIIPSACAYTDSPTSFRELWTQRVRWAGGTWQELFRAGWRPYTRRTWMTAFASLFSTVFRLLAIVAFSLVVVYGLPLHLSWFWLLPIAVAVWDRLDQTRYTRRADWKDRILAGTILPMEFIGLVRETWNIKSAVSAIRGSHLKW